MQRATPFGALTALFLAILPFIFSRHLFFSAVNARYFFIIFVTSALLLVAAYQFWNMRNEIRFKHRPLLYSAVLMLGVYYVAALLGVFPEHSLWSDIIRSSGVLFITHVFLLAFILGEFLKERDWVVIRRTVAVSAGVFGALSLIGQFYTGRFLWMSFGIDGFTLGNSTFAGSYLVLALFLALIEVWHSERGTNIRKVLIASIILVLFSPAIFNFGSLFEPIRFLGDARASSATAWLLMIFLGGFLLLRKYFRGTAKKYVLWGWSGVWLFAVMVGIAMLFTPGSFVQDKYIESSTAARIIVWESAMEAVKERPILGYGPENFERAIQKNFDNRLFLDENIGEIWFDRAHNIIVDTLISIGFLGILASLLLISAFVRVAYRASKKGVINNMEAMLLVAIIPAHIIQLQTGFNTVGTYVLLGIILGYVLWLERNQMESEDDKKSFLSRSVYRKILAGVFAGIALLSLKYMLFDEYQRQKALFGIFTTNDGDTHLAFIEKATSQRSDFESLRLSSSSFIKGTFILVADKDIGRQELGAVRDQIALYNKRYEAYIMEEPEHYRARMNYAYLLLAETILGKDRLNEAKNIIGGSYGFSPNNPLTYALDATASLYAGNIKEAKEIMTKGIALNPDIDFSREIMTHIEEQERNFPSITILKLENL